MSGCKRAGKWCVFARFHEKVDYEASQRNNELTTFNEFECLAGMNCFPPSDSLTNGGPSFNEEDGTETIWKTAMESYGSTTDSMAEGVDRGRGLDMHGRYETGNETVIPGDAEDPDIEVTVEEACVGLKPETKAAVEHLVFSEGLRLVEVTDDEITTEEVARHIFLKEYRRVDGWNSSCPDYVHPSFMYFKNFGQIKVLIKHLLEGKKYGEIVKIHGLLTRHKKLNRGSINELLKDPENRSIWVRIEKLVYRLRMLARKGKIRLY